MKRLLTKRLLAQRYSVTLRSIERWAELGILPPPQKINSRCYWDEAEIECRERERMAAQQPESAA